MWKQLLTLIILLQTQLLVAQQSKLHAVYSLEDDWKVYSHKWEGLIPFTPKRHQGQKQFFLNISSSFHSEDYIEIKVPKKTDVFIGDVLLFTTIDSTETWRRRIGDLRIEKNDDVLLVVNSALFQAKPPLAQVLSTRLTDDAFRVETQENVLLKTRPDDTQRQEILLICISLFIVLTFLFRRVGLRFDTQSFSHFFDLITFRRMKQHSYSGVAISLFFLGYIIMSTLVLVTISDEGNNSGVLWVDQLFWEPNLWIKTIGFFLFTTAIELARLALMWTLSKITGNKQLQVIHLLEYVELTKVFMSIVLMCFAFILFNPFPGSREFLELLVVISLLLKAFFITFSVYRQLPLQKNYLFSYFCGAEFLPTLLIVKIFIQF
ncbi:DUF4271 domain-containing protein [Sediminitomix flava]|uniref:Uncharacterized protein DUF4271 n=1 Tax=Sediminitomix flava TaxID=379075 RepID=A0A315Z9A3_SEDFL|nr:DUF4271 domain-containing protein [Sediminitomix flava]PWJ40784.1 uncharacterized protein DUF4271 [Sediminitomix flava]